jgi:hypothetical protein
MGLLTVFCLLICGCENTNNALDTSNQQLLGNAPQNSKMGKSKIASTGFSQSDPLMPTGDCDQDTPALQAAIQDAALNTGGTLYLGPGTFQICGTIIRHGLFGEFGYNPDPFNGTIQGAGKGVTIIKAVRGSGGEPFTPSFDGYPMAFAIWDQDYFGIRDLTFESDSEIADWWDFFWPTQGLLSYVNIGSGIYNVGGQYGADCINVQFNGSFDSNGFPEIPLLFEVFGNGSGTYNIKSSEFNNGSFLYIDFTHLANATVNIGGSPKEKVIFTNDVENYWPIAISPFGVGDCNFNVSHIETYNMIGLSLFSHPLNSMSYVTMNNNLINMMSGSWWGGVELWGQDYGDISAVISNNKFRSNSGDIFGPIVFSDVENGVITNNKFSGWGPVAINVGFFELPGSVSLLGNNVQTWETAENPFVPNLYAPIWLGPNITNSIVVGGNNKNNIWDLGDDNYYTGVNNAQQTIGQKIKDFMKQRADALKAMRD